MLTTFSHELSAVPTIDTKNPEQRSMATDGKSYGDLFLDQQLCLALHVATSEVTRLYREQLEPLGLTYSQYLVLIGLWEQPRSSMGDLRRALNMDTGTLTPLVKRMEKAGLVRRIRDAVDERRVWVELTPAGWELRDPVLEARKEVVRRLPLTGEQIAALRASLQLMNDVLLTD